MRLPFTSITSMSGRTLVSSLASITTSSPYMCRSQVAMISPCNGNGTIYTYLATIRLAQVGDDFKFNIHKATRNRPKLLFIDRNLPTLNFDY